MTILGMLSYAAAAIGFLLLAVLLLTSWRRPDRGVYLVGATCATAAWAGILSIQRSESGLPASVFVAEMLRDIAWLLVLANAVKPSSNGALARVARIFVPTVILGAIILGYLYVRLSVTADSVVWLRRMGLALSILGLIFLEQIYRNANQTARDELRCLVLGIGAMFAYDLFLYSQAEMLRGIVAETWDLRGVLNAFAAPLIAVAARRTTLSSLDIFVSRQVTFHTAVVGAAGAYLLLMALVGYYVRTLENTWSVLIQALFLAASFAVFSFAVFSAAWRRHLRVFITKHFYRNKYDYRVEWLRFVQTLSATAVEDVRCRSVRAVAQIFLSPGGILFTTDESNRRFVPFAAWPHSVDNIPGIAPVRREAGLIRLMSDREWIIDLQEYRRAPEAYQNIELPGWLHDNSDLRIVSPLLQLDQLVGFVVLFEPPAPFELTYEDRDLLKTVGRHVATHIAQHEADRRLAESKQFEAYNRLTAFMMHDLKNSVAQLKLLVNNAERHKRNPAFIDDAVDTIANAAERMTRLIEQLRGTTSAPCSRNVSLSELARLVVSRCGSRQPRPVLDVADPSVQVIGDADRIASIIEHLIRNAQDATSGQPDGAVRVRVQPESGEALLVVADTGCGMDAEFLRERLFRPFDSTKGSKGMGIGAYQVREYVHMLGGEVEVQSLAGRGTSFYIKLPLARAEAPPVASPASPNG